jgi:hypothetical protein
MPNDVKIVNLKQHRKGKKPMYSFTVMLDDDVIMLGFRYFAKALQPPMRKGATSYYPTTYVSRPTARRIYDAFATQHPELPLFNFEICAKHLAYDDFTITCLNMFAEDEMAEEKEAA